MKTETWKRVSLTRTELEQAIRKFCGIPDSATLDGLWFKSEHLAAPQPVCGFNYVAEAVEG